MNDTVKELREIKRLLARIADKLGADADKPKTAGGADTTSIVKRFGRVISVNDGDGDVPSQLTADEKAAQRFIEGVDHARALGRARTSWPTRSWETRPSRCGARTWTKPYGAC